MNWQKVVFDYDSPGSADLYRFEHVLSGRKDGYLVSSLCRSLSLPFFGLTAWPPESPMVKVS